ncbi:MAG: NADPH:quinone oxidoreductase family protein [Chloroflexota bacterium]|nr:NADPH:quinone oxidoreductase family protein [Chloroflexota bacterium]MDE2948545.1 NADPH:quinone oxidoreductase family protein [Chloroflexota bacterium]
MKAVLCHSFGPPENLSAADIPSPPLEDGQVRIAVRACGVNFPDALMIQGLYQFKPAFPFSPGLEVAGDIIEVAADVNELAVGGRVMATMMFGGFAEEVVVPAATVLPMPDGMSYEQGAGFCLAYGTSHVALTHRARLQANETLLVLGAAGGLGLTAVELGKIIGARVIAAASSPAKLELARSYGADDTILYTGENLRDRLNALTDGRGVDVIFDPVGGDIFDQAVRRIAWEGRYLVIGFASGRIPSLPLNIALLKNASIVGLFWGAYLQNNPRVIRESFLELAALFAAGVLKPHIHQVFPLDEAASALRELMNRRAMGKILLKT